jgi:hypothetical protein
MDFLKPKLSFDASKPFHALVTNCLVQMNGLVEVQMRGLTSQFASLQSRIASPRLRDNVADVSAGLQHSYQGGSAGWMGTFGLASNADAGQLIEVDARRLSSLWSDPSGSNVSITYYQRMIFGSLLVLAWEFTLEAHTYDPIWEFLRHCRNAAAHGGYFKFKWTEPSRPAAWKSLEIIKSMQALPLFTEGTRGFLHFGDPLLLLWDIEQAFPAIKPIA